MSASQRQDYAKEFNRILFDTLRAFNKKAQTDEEDLQFDRMRNRFKILCGTDAADESLIKLAYQPIFYHSEAIRKDVSTMFDIIRADVMKANDRLGIDFFDTIVRIYQRLDDKERKLLQQKAITAHDVCLNWKLTTMN